jgi:hypothetical protein
MVFFNKICICCIKRAHDLRNYYLDFSWKYVGISILD